MTAQTLPDEPNFCFCPAYDVETEMQQIRIVIEGLAGHVPTALVTLDLDDALWHLRQAQPPPRAGPRGMDRHGRRLHARRGRRSAERSLALKLAKLCPCLSKDDTRAPVLALDQRHYVGRCRNASDPKHLPSRGRHHHEQARHFQFLHHGPPRPSVYPGRDRSAERMAVPFAHVSLPALRLAPSLGRGRLMPLVPPCKRRQRRLVGSARLGAIDNLNMRPPVGADQDSPAFYPPCAGAPYSVEETADFVAEQNVFDSLTSTASRHRPDNDPTAAGSCP